MGAWDADKSVAVRLPAARFWPALFASLANLIRQVRVRRKVRSLRLQETLQLGDRRFLALVEWQQKKLLLGVTPGSITLIDTACNNGADPESDAEGRAL